MEIILSVWFLLSLFGFILNFIAFKKTFAGNVEYNLWIEENSNFMDGAVVIFITIIFPIIYVLLVINIYDIVIGKDNNLIQVIFKVKD